MKIWASARRAWELQEVTTAAMGCKAAPKTGQLGSVWQTEAAGFAVGYRQFADKSAPTDSDRPHKSLTGRVKSPGVCGQARRRPVRFTV
ncbi:hypothetical protein DND90_10405 [Pseudomonas syringae pv. maculicola]|nr:hypothetical protein DND90_10405 [Pseudomonas syringae pv. maculicola]